MMRPFVSVLALASLFCGSEMALAEPGETPVVNDVPVPQAEPKQADALTPTPPPAVLTLANWRTIPQEELKLLNDDDIHRHAFDVHYLDGIGVGELKFAENGFDWQLIRFTNVAKPTGPLWMVPHDDENAAFDAMIDAVKLYGGVGITVNSTGWGRLQPGSGSCGTRERIVSSCDPNRNFADRTPSYTSAFLDQRPAGQPIIALHTNKPGYGDGQGNISMYASAKQDSFFGNGSVPALDNPDTFGLMSYRIGVPTPEAVNDCRVALNAAGINFWKERVGASDGSMSNYLILNHPEITYFNAESRQEADPAVAAARHGMMAAAFLRDCQTHMIAPVSAEAAPPPPAQTVP